MTIEEFFLFHIETICCDPSSECFVKMVQMRGQNICFMQN